MSRSVKLEHDISIPEFPADVTFDRTEFLQSFQAAIVYDAIEVEFRPCSGLCAIVPNNVIDVPRAWP